MSIDLTPHTFSFALASPINSFHFATLFHALASGLGVALPINCFHFAILFPDLASGLGVALPINSFHFE